MRQQEASDLPRAVNLRERFEQVEAAWHPHVAASLNGQHVKLVRLEGDFIWHHHEEADELFLVVAGRLEMHFRDGVVPVEAGELIVVPRGVEHRPVAPEGAEVVLFEPAGTRNTGHVGGPRTREPVME